MSVLISNDAELDTLLDAQEVEHICEVVLAAEGVEREVEISLSYVDEDEMHELNHEWRGIDRTTDVLSFECDSAFDEDIPADEALELGDIILAPQVIAEKRHIYKGVSTNVDFYSGFVYDMLGIPVELYTPIFAIARIVGWSAHRMEELVNVDKIIRPAYQSIMQTREYVPLEER